MYILGGTLSLYKWLHGWDFKLEEMPETISEATHRPASVFRTAQDGEVRKRRQQRLKISSSRASDPLCLPAISDSFLGCSAHLLAQRKPV